MTVNLPRLAGVVVLFVAVAAPMGPSVVVAARTTTAVAGPTTVVSLTFDDGQASHYSTLPILEWRGMRGTYYINSDMVGTSGYYMTWAQIRELAEAGNEIGGHTATHVDLSKVSPATARREICDDRKNLLAEGFAPVASFAYPYAARNRTAEKIVAECGYTTGRPVGDIYGADCKDCPYAETMPPRNAFAMRAPDSADISSTVAQLASYVTEAEQHGGGWVILSFHGVCADECTGEQSLDPAVFAAFLDWLGPRQSNGTVVRTVGEVMGAPPSREIVPAPVPADSPPVTTIRCDGSPCDDTWRRSAVNVSFSATDPDGSAVASTRYTTDGTDPATSRTAEAYSVPLRVASTTTIRYASSDVDGNGEVAGSQRVRVDTVAPAVKVTNPAPGSSAPRGAHVVAATAADGADGAGIRRVVFKDGTKTIRTDSSAPFRFAWTTGTTAALGVHRLTAIATDAAGNVTTSAPVSFTVTARARS